MSAASTVAATVAVIDYGMGNLRSVSQAVEHAAKDLNLQVVVTNDPKVVHAAERVVLPGQGAMRDCMRELREAHGGDLFGAVLDAAQEAVDDVADSLAARPSGDVVVETRSWIASLGLGK